MRGNPTHWLTWPLTAAFVVVLMSFDDPYRIALASLMLGMQGPVWRWIHALDPALRRVTP